MQTLSPVKAFGVYDDHASLLDVVVHDLGHGHIEVSAQRVYRYTPHDGKPSARSVLSDEERDADNAARAARRAKSQVRKRVKSMGLDTLLTLTYRQNVTDEDKCKAHLEDFVRRMKKALGSFAYVAALERQKRGAWHVHLAVHRIPSHLLREGVRVKSFDLVRSVWRSVVGDAGGNIDLSKKKRTARFTAARMAAYIAKYITKTHDEDVDDRKFRKRYSASRYQLPPKHVLYDLATLDLASCMAVCVSRLSPAGTIMRLHLNPLRDGFFLVVEPDLGRNF